MGLVQPICQQVAILLIHLNTRPFDIFKTRKIEVFLLFLSSSCIRLEFYRSLRWIGISHVIHLISLTEIDYVIYVQTEGYGILVTVLQTNFAL